MIKRKFIDFGLQPWVAFFSIPLLFLISSYILFSKIENAPYIYIAINLTFLMPLGKKERNDFLKICFSTNRYRYVRIIENLLVTLPFLLFLLSYLHIYPFFCLLVLSIGFSQINFINNFKQTIPTPFQKPFEFTVGFRSTFWFFPLIYMITVISVIVNNYNLGLFSLIAISLICLSYFQKPENEYYIWSFSLSPKGFLFAKTRMAIWYLTLLNVGPLVILLCFFPGNIFLSLAIFALGYFYLITAILAKYAAYPYELNLPYALLLIMSLLFPPALLVIMPYFYSKSTKKLSSLLHD